MNRQESDSKSEKAPLTDADGAPRKSGNGKTERFPEPKAWALKWDRQDYDQIRIPREDHPVTLQTPKQPGADSEPTALASVTQPKGWALRWDGLSIAAIQAYYNPDTVPTDSDSE